MAESNEFAREFGENSKLAIVLQALRSADPVGTLGSVYYWVPADVRQRYVDEAIPFDNVGDLHNLQAAGERFLHGAIASKPEVPPLPTWDRVRVVGMLLAGLMAVALITAVVITR
ncbi:MAG TPA: hypothetical protein VGL39_27760 [Jatrophihabitantaceae bacterium]|jgi:hypothetical protein